MALPQKENVYLDANFLIAYFVPDHADNASAAQLFADLLINNDFLNLTGLTVDEVLHGIVKEARQVRGNSSLPHAHFHIDLRKAVEALKNSPQVLFRQFNTTVDNGCLEAVENIKRYTLRPRDAFHCAYIDDLDIGYIVSRDTDFDNVSGLTRIGF